jgi:hypothetical protein
MAVMMDDRPQDMLAFDVFEGGGRVRHEDRLITKVMGLAEGRIDTDMGSEPGDKERVHFVVAEIGIKVRTREGADANSADNVKFVLFRNERGHEIRALAKETAAVFDQLA